jgi:aspartate/glutamate racemase
MKKKLDKIGVLGGGIGALASAIFLTRLLLDYSKLTKAVNDDDFPEILYLSSPLRGFSEKGVIDRKKVKDQINHSLQFLIKKNVKIIFIVCVSVMDIVKEIKVPNNVKIINLADITNNHLGDGRYTGKRILVLSSNYTHREGLFESENCIVRYVSDKEQEKIDELIYLAISNKKISHSSFLRKLIKRYSADYLLLGCTELPLIISRHNKIKVIDPLNLAIEEYAKMVRLKKTKQEKG